jgi:hypothetical protein
MKVLICGGRDYYDTERIREALLKVGGITEVIQGGAKGADRTARSVAEQLGIMVREFPADWEKYGKAAGPIRNQQMLNEGKPDLVIAFPGGKGTQDMINRAKKAGVKVTKICEHRL